MNFIDCLFYIPFFVLLLYFIPGIVFYLNDKKKGSQNLSSLETSDIYKISIRRKNILFSIIYYGILFLLQFITIISAIFCDYSDLFIVVFKSGIVYLSGLIIACIVYILGYKNKKIDNALFRRKFITRIFPIISLVVYIMIYLLNFIPQVSLNFILPIYQLDMWVGGMILSNLLKFGDMLVVIFCVILTIGIPTTTLFIKQLINEKKVKNNPLLKDSYTKNQNSFFRIYYLILNGLMIFYFYYFLVQTKYLEMVLCSLLIYFAGVILQSIAYLIVLLLLKNKKKLSEFQNICNKTWSIFYKYILPTIFVISIAVSLLLDYLFSIL